jgi:hypothetical protein
MLDATFYSYNSNREPTDTDDIAVRRRGIVGDQSWLEAGRIGKQCAEDW